MATLAQLHAKIDLAVTAFEGDNFAGAIKYATSAELILAVLPDSTFDGNDSIRFDRQGALMLIKNIKAQCNAGIAAAAGGTVTELVQYQRAGSEDE